ncbi:nitrite reductase [Geothermobacter hydrogeniphilus]|uniref:Nitrite reductase n=1 Tax=Geothermobacter hydrogeniphilus TaxID=1969733 RepID=A0A2K2H5V1_9BACT|nr:nitrite/sulfite reductase [Geothermobacter hydrogeniphilus]PNU18593.1 nitrite reductase [Geothermobacter hydrogeniphilus]
MNYDPQQLRLDGIYQQTGEDRWMQRIKVPAGALASEQGLKVAELAERYAGGRLHLTTRCSIELHDLSGKDLAAVNRGLASIGLTGRGACGGAVRGISCSTSSSVNYPACQALARKLQRHFAGNPYFEGLPKKFKIGIDGEKGRGRHLIQDTGLVYAGEKEGQNLWDVWCAGGLGREPRAGLLLGERIPESRLIPLIEGLVFLYREQVEKGKRLKHLVKRVGEEEFRRLLREKTPEPPPYLPASGLGETLTERPGSGEEPLTVPIFAGELDVAAMRLLCRLATRYAGGVLLLTADQDIALVCDNEKHRAALQQRLILKQLGEQATRPQPVFRVCPGSHECRMGLCATRDIARSIINELPPAALGLRFAISGCPNSCSQPQLADYGILPRKLVKDDDGNHSPRFDLLKRDGEGLGEIIAENLDLQQLRDAIQLELDTTEQAIFAPTADGMI